MSFEATQGGVPIYAPNFLTQGNNAASRYLADYVFTPPTSGSFGLRGMGSQSALLGAANAQQTQVLQALQASIAAVSTALSQAQAASQAAATQFQSPSDGGTGLASINTQLSQIATQVQTWTGQTATSAAGPGTGTTLAQVQALQTQLAPQIAQALTQAQSLQKQVATWVSTQQSAAGQAVSNAINQANGLAQQGQYGQALAVVQNPALQVQATAAGGSASGNLQSAIQLIESSQTSAPATAAQQQVTQAISQANALNTQGATSTQLQQALSILQGVQSAAQTAGATYVTQLNAAITPIQNALNNATTSAVSTQITNLVSQANSMAQGGNFSGALALLQSNPTLQAQDTTGQIASAIATINGQQTQQSQFNANVQSAQQACVAQGSGFQFVPGQWSPGSTNYGSCNPTAATSAAQADCTAQGGNYIPGGGCDMTAVNQANAAGQQACVAQGSGFQWIPGSGATSGTCQQTAASQQQQQTCADQGGNWTGSYCDMSQVQQQNQAVQAQQQAAASCATNGGFMDYSGGLTDALGNPVGVCNMSQVDAAKQSQQQAQTFASLATAFAPILAANPQLATQVVGQAFQAAGGGMQSVPGGNGGGGYGQGGGGGYTSMSTGGGGSSGSLNSGYTPGNESF